MDILEFKGSDYEIGFQTGKYFFNIAQKLYRSLYFSAEILQLAEKSFLYLQKAAPDQLEQVKGFSRATREPFLNVLTYLAYQNQVTEGSERCTTILVQTENGPLIGHSEDDYAFNQNKFFLAKFFPRGEPSYISGCYIGLISGDNFGMNKYGLTVSVNSLNFKGNFEHPQAIGLPMSFIGNFLLRMKNLKEAENFLQKVLPSQACHFLVVSAEGLAISAELMPNGARKIKKLTSIAHANHPLDKELFKFCDATTSSINRQAIVNSWLKKHDSKLPQRTNAIGVKEMQDLLKIQSANNLGIYRKGFNPYKDISTIASFIAQPGLKSIFINKDETFFGKKWEEVSLRKA